LSRLTSLAALRTLPSGSPARVSRTKSGLNRDWCNWPIVVNASPRTTESSSTPFGEPAKKPSGVMASQAPSRLARRLASRWQVATSQMRTTPSVCPETTQRLSRGYAADKTLSDCPKKLHSRRPVDVSHSLSVLSRLPVRRREPSGEKATELTQSE